MKSVLIFGSEGALGSALCQVYEKTGWQVNRCNRSNCDLSQPSSIQSFLATLKGEKIDLCIFTSAVSEVGYVDQVSDQAFRNCIEVNFFSQIQILYTLARQTHPCLRFVFILSGTAEFLIPGLAPYSLSKRLIRDFIEILRCEKSFKNYYFLEVWPGSIQSHFNQKTKIHSQFTLPNPEKAKTPESIALLIYQAEQKNLKTLRLSKLPWLLGKLQATFPLFLRLLIQIHPKLRRR